MVSSLRPRSRPIKDQTEEMLRPKSRLDAQKEKEKKQLQMKTFGDLEYRADLDKQLSWNPIARLGYDPDAHKVFKQIEPKTGLAFQGGGPKTIKKLKELGYEGAEKAQQGSVITTANYSFSPVISHEFTHMGFDILKKRRNENPEAFDKKYGEDAGKILELTESGKLKEEYYIEFFDDLNTRFNTDMLPEDFKEFPKSTIRDTVQSYPSGPAVSIADRGEEKRNKRVAEIKKFQNIDLKRKEKGKKSLYLDKIDKGILGLMDAAQDILTEQGEPPKAKMKTLSFWEKVGKSFSNLKPVGTRGLYEGGLSAQTEEAFNTDAEGRRRRRHSQAYLERSKEGTGQVVENVLGALPGIGTAMTAEEIQEELQKDDPNYGKIALLGGSELIGLIPGLGTAAKTGLRKVANNIGADRIIKALDAPKPKPESEIIAGPGATGYYDSNYDRAKELEEKGYSPAQIEQMTGRFQTGKSSDYIGDIPENPFKFEIDDSRVEIKSSDGFQTLKESTRHSPIAVGHIIPTHTELFKEYPNLRNVAFYIDPKKTGSGAHFDDTVGTHGAIVFSPNNKSLTSPNKKGFRNTFFHELQHAAQFQDYKIAGLKQLGGNPVFFGRVGTKEYPSYKIQKDMLEKNKNFVKLRDEILDIFEKQRGTGALDQTSIGATLPGQVPNPSEVFGDVAVAKKIARKMRELESELFKTYMRTVSEVEARVVGGRAEKIATVGSVPKPRVTSNLARERKIETLKEFQSDEPKSLMGKKVEDFKLKLGPMTDEEILRYATGGINFARYAKGIDKDLQGFDLFGPTKPNYAEGGTVDMNRQMEMAFMKEGGLKDDGMKVDPVSGNEIPPGSMAKEVRDDIPAQLSEGEYVVPADVVQFYGVKHFEDLRNKAKNGLKQMENDGRIGGEPVYANTGTMVQGGFSGPSVAPAQPGVAQIPMPLQNPAPFNPMQTPLQGNPGAGFVYQTPGQQAYNQPTRYYGSFSNAPQSITQPPNTPVPVVGQPVTPPVDTPESCAARGMVFNPETGMCVLPDPVQTPQPTGGDDRDKPDVPQGDPDAWMDKYSYDDVDKLLSESSGALDPATGLAGFLGKVLGGGVLGLFAKGSNAAQVAANINVLSSIPESSLTASQKESLAGLKTKYENYVTSNNLDIFGTELINGDQLAIDIITNPKNRGKGLFLTADSVDPFGNKIFKGGEKDPKFIKVMEDVALPGYTYVPGDDDNLGYYKADSDTKLAPDVSLRPPTRPTNVTPVQTTTTPTVKKDKDKKAFKEQHAAFVAKTRTDKDSMVATAEKAAKTGTAAGAAAKSYADIAKKDDEYALLNKGGLMKRK